LRVQQNNVRQAIVYGFMKEGMNSGTG